MTSKRLLIHTIALFLLPLIVVAFGFSFITTLLLVLLVALWRWLIALSTFFYPEQCPDVILDTTTASHFVEKVRWNMDVAGIEYVENPSGGTLGAYFTGRTVPRLRVRTGLVQSQIGNSPEILRYLWGAYATALGERASHLAPTAERLELEKRLDRYGRNLQVWLFYHVLDYPELALRIWGADDEATPAWQRRLLPLVYPVIRYLVRRSFRVTKRHYEKVSGHIEDLLSDIDTTLADGRESIIEGDQRNYTDYTFAAFTGLWLQPDNYGGDKAKQVRVARERVPDAMRRVVERWSEDYPKATAFVEELYANERAIAGTNETTDRARNGDE